MAEYFEEAKAYIGWSDADVARLRAIEPIVRPHFAQFADHFYAVIQRHPRAMAVVSGGEAQITRLKTTLIDWMATGVSGPHDQAFYDRRSRIGRRHVAIGLPQEYMFTAINVLRLDYHAALIAAGPPDELYPTIAAVDKLFDLELAIMLRHYQLHSEERLVERERRTRDEKLIAMQTLSAGLAHEVRNPLNAARLQLELLERRLRRSTSDDRLLDTAGLINHEFERLTRMLNEFLSFARPPELSATPHDLVAITRSVLELEQVKAEAAGVTLHLVGDDRPQVATVDPDRMHQIIQNLVRNAIEATPSGGRVEVELAVTAPAAEVRVRDTGAGIPRETRARIYEPFFSTKPEGTGMGMAIVHNLVTAHGGSIELDTEVGRGTTFTVVLPSQGK